MGGEKNVVTGVVLEDGEVQWTTLRRKKSRLEVARRSREPLGLPEPVDFASPEAATRLKNLGKEMPGAVCLALPTDQVLTRVLDLPAAEPDELAGMVELQVDKFSPFPVEHLQISCEVLDRRDGTSRVLVAAAQRDRVQAFGTPFVGAGLVPHRIDLAVMAWWDILREADAVLAEGGELVLLLDRLGADLVIALDGWPTLIRSLGRYAAFGDLEAVAEISDEIGYTLTALESERGALRLSRAVLWHWGNATEVLAGAVRDACRVPVEVRSFDALPSLSEGLARRGMQPRLPALDLAPTEWHEAVKRRVARRSLVAATLALVALWSLVVGVFVVGVRLERNRIARLKNRVEELEKPAEQVKELRGRVQSLEQYADRTRSALECLREATVLMPSGVEMTSFLYKKNASVSLRGQSDAAGKVYDYLEGLTKSPLFVAVKPGGVTETTKSGRRVSEFQITADLPEVPE